VVSDTKSFDNTNRWTLFRNVDKKNENSPEFSGKINIDGVEYLLNGWVKEGQNQKFFSGTVRPKPVAVTSTTTELEDVPF